MSSDTEMVAELLLVVLAGGIMSAFIAAFVASEKGYGYGTWWLIGFLTGPIGLLGAVGLPVRSRPPTTSALAKTQTEIEAQTDAAIARYKNRRERTDEAPTG